MKKHSWKERENKRLEKKNIQEYTVNIKRRFTSLPLLSKNLLILFWKILRGKILYYIHSFPLYLTPSVTSSGILYNRQMAEGTEP